jgi:hypothetical protein
MGNGVRTDWQVASAFRSASCYSVIGRGSVDSEPAQICPPRPDTAPEPEPEANNPPQISGNPATEIAVGSSYGFTPAASDPEGNNLVFSISNKPAWASFNTGKRPTAGLAWRRRRRQLPEYPYLRQRRRIDSAVTRLQNRRVWHGDRDRNAVLEPADQQHRLARHCSISPAMCCSTGPNRVATQHDRHREPGSDDLRDRRPDARHVLLRDEGGERRRRTERLQRRGRVQRPVNPVVARARHPEWRVGRGSVVS